MIFQSKKYRHINEDVKKTFHEIYRFVFHLKFPYREKIKGSDDEEGIVFGFGVVVGGAAGGGGAALLVLLGRVVVGGPEGVDVIVFDASVGLGFIVGVAVRIEDVLAFRCLFQAETMIQCIA